MNNFFIKKINDIQLLETISSDSISSDEKRKQMELIAYKNKLLKAKEKLKNIEIEEKACNRLYNHALELKEKKEIKQKEKIKEETAKDSFSPKLNPKSVKITNQNQIDPIYKRVNYIN